MSSRRWPCAEAGGGRRGTSELTTYLQRPDELLRVRPLLELLSAEDVLYPACYIYAHDYSARCALMISFDDVARLEAAVAELGDRLLNDLERRRRLVWLEQQRDADLASLERSVERVDGLAGWRWGVIVVVGPAADDHGDRAGGRPQADNVPLEQLHAKNRHQVQALRDAKASMWAHCWCWDVV